MANKRKSAPKWEQVGVIGVDAGICWIGDPCYVFHHDPPPEELGKTWHEFCDRITSERYIGPCPDCRAFNDIMDDKTLTVVQQLEAIEVAQKCKTCSGTHRQVEYINHWQLNYDAGHPGLGVCVSTGWGDGMYPVEVRKIAGRIAEVRVKFM